jgi:hypothetical protein
VPATEDLLADQEPTAAFETIPADDRVPETSVATLRLTRKQRRAPPWIGLPRAPTGPGRAWGAGALAAAVVLLVCAALALSTSDSGHGGGCASSTPNPATSRPAQAPHRAASPLPSVASRRRASRRRAPRSRRPRQASRRTRPLLATPALPPAAAAQTASQGPPEEPSASMDASEGQTPGGPFSP